MKKLEALAFLNKVIKNYQKIERLTKQMNCNHEYKVDKSLGMVGNRYKRKCTGCGKVL